MKNNREEKNNSRDLMLGYTAVGSSYAIIAILGYLGFRGNGFP